MHLWSDKWNINMLIIQIKKSNLEIKSALRYLTTTLIIGHQFLLIEDLKIYKLHKTYRYLLLSLIMRKTKKEKICLQKIKVRVYKLEKVVIQKYVVQVQTIKVALSLKYRILSTLCHPLVLKVKQKRLLKPTIKKIKTKT